MYTIWVLDVCYLGGTYHDKKGSYNVYKNILKSDTSLIWHSHAYLIRKRAVIRLVDMSKSDWMTHPERGLNVYKVEPELVKFGWDGVSDTSK
jgi:hypothetical protein